MSITFDTAKYFEYIAAIEAERAMRDFAEGVGAGDPPPVHFLEPAAPDVELSVVIPAWNPAEPQFRRCLNSLIAADFAGITHEIVVSDDASASAVVEQCVKQAASPHVRYVRQKTNLGGFGNFNWCLSAARGAWIHMLHQDDWIEPGFYQELLRGPAAASGAALRFCRVRLDDGSGANRLMFDEAPAPGVIQDFLTRQSMSQRIQISGAICARQAFAEVGGYDARLGTGADWELWARVAAGRPVFYSPKPLATFSLHQGSWSSRTSGGAQDAKSFSDHRQVLMRLLKHLPAAGRHRSAHGFVLNMLQRLLQSASVNKRLARLPLNRANVEALLVGCRDAGLSGDIERVLATL